LSDSFRGFGTLGLPCFAGRTHRDIAPELQLQVTDNGEHFHYSITYPESVRAAWIEVVDLPQVLDTKTIPIQSSGELDWEWKWDQQTGYLREEQEEDARTLTLWDPGGVSLVCRGTTMYSEPGGEVSKSTVGGRTNFDPQPSLNSSLVRVLQGSRDFTFEVTGKDLVPQTTFHAFTEKTAKCEDRFIHARVLDLAHARVTINHECLKKAGILFVSTSSNPSYDTDKVWIHVAGGNSPSLRSVTPSRVREDEPPGQLKLLLSGTHFTRDSQVDADYMPDGLDYNEVSQLNLDTEYISPTELHAWVHTEVGDTSLVRTLGWNRTAFRIWVEGSSDKFELSESRDVEVRRSSGKTLRHTALVTSISPYPIRLMDEHSPEELEITIHGENFVPENQTMFSAAVGVPSRSKYASPTTLYAWIPRQYWRKHHFVYRLVVETSTGHRYSRQVESSNDE
jgi:hypothetical protein